MESIEKAIDNSIKKVNTKFRRRRYLMQPCEVKLQDDNGVVKSFRGRRSADGTRYIPHGEGWRNAEKFAKKRGLKLLAE